MSKTDEMPALRSLQTWFLSVVTHPGELEEGITAAPLRAELGVTDDETLERVLTRGPRLSARDRLAVYHHAYVARLVEGLEDDYPAVAFAVGGDAFARLARLYIERHPSRSPNLNAFGAAFASFLAEVEDDALSSAPRGFLVDLARLEWAIVETIHAADGPVVSVHDLAAVPEGGWAGVALRPHATARLLKFAYPVNTYFQGFRDGREPQVPDAHATAVVVVRREERVWRWPLSAPMAALLEGLFAGEPLGIALERLEPFGDTDEAGLPLVAAVMGWFRDWVSFGLFAGVDF